MKSFFLRKTKTDKKVFCVCVAGGGVGEGGGEGDGGTHVTLWQFYWCHIFLQECFQGPLNSVSKALADWCLPCLPINSLQKHAYSNIQIRKILPPKNENFQIKNSDIFHISAHNIDCGYSLELPRRGGSNEYPQSMFWTDIRKLLSTPVNPSFST